MYHWRTNSLCRTYAVLLLLCVLAVRVIVPQGYMWSTGTSGAPEMVVCSGFGPAPELSAIAATALAAQQHSEGGHRHDGQSADHPCAFAAAAATIDLAAVRAPLPNRPSDVVAATRRTYARPGLGLAAPPPPKTGPPAFA